MPSIRTFCRRLLIACTAGVLSVAIGLAILRVPAVQTWLAKRIVASQPGWSLEADRIDVGPKGIQARGIDFVMPGLTAKSAPISIRVRPSRLLRREIAIEQVSINQLNIEITPAELAASAPNAPIARAFTGVLELLQAPLAWTVAKTDINARFGLREAGRTVATGDVTLSGGNLTPGSTGTFAYSLSAASALLPVGPENTIRSKGTLRIDQNTTRGVARIEIDGSLQLPSYGGFTPPAATLLLVLENTPAGERYRADVKFGDEAQLTILSGFNPKDEHTGFDLQFSAQPAFLARLDPRLTSLGAWQAHLVSFLDLKAAAPEPFNTRLVMRSDSTPFRFTVEQNGANRTAQITLAGLPLAWIQPLLTDTDITLKGGNVNAEWTAVLKDSGEITGTPNAALTLGPVTLTASALPPLPPITVSLSPSLMLSSETLIISAPDFTATTESGDRITAAFSFAHTLATGRSHSAGSLDATLPTLLASPGQPLPFLVAARWDATLESDGGFLLDALEFTARQSAAADPFVSLTLQQPLSLGSTAALTSLKSDAAQDLLCFSVKNLPLAWLSRWSSGVALEGEWATGESVLRHAPEGGFSFITRTPWSFVGLNAVSAGKPLFAGAARLEPEFRYSENLWSAHLRSFQINESSGNRASGDVSFDWLLDKKHFTASFNLDAALPSLPHSAESFGALDISLKAKARTVDGKVSQVEQLALSVRNAGGPLLTLATTQPVLFVRKPNGETIFNSLGPLRLKTPPLPLAWAQPWLPAGTSMTGTLGPTDLLLHAEPQNFRLRPLIPLTLENLAVTRDGVTSVKDARLSFFPGMDIQLLYQLLPTFQLAYQGRFHATEGQLDLGATRAADFELALGFIGNPETTLPQSIDLQALLDLGVFDSTREGRVVARLNGDLLGGGEPLDFWARLDRVKALPAFEVSAHGNVNGRKREAGFDVSIQYFTTPVTSDAAFHVTLGLDSDTLNFDSALRSQFMDVTAALELAEALQPKTPSATAKNAAPAGPVGPRTFARMAKLGTPFWSVLRGHFGLDLAAVAFAPYRIDDLRGRLDVTENKLTFSGLTGTMFAGKWSGGLGITYDAAGESDHSLKGNFHIQQFETARVVQTVFPNEFGSFDARINLDATVRSDGNGLWELFNRAEGGFVIEGHDGVARLTHPAAGTAATVLVLGGAVTFSPELRALGRLLRKFAEMPVNTLRISGARDAIGNILLSEFRLDSPQARLIGRGAVPMQDDVALAGRRLDLGLELFARDEIGVILGNMKLLEKRADADGYRRMTQPVMVGGEVGRPDASPLYDLLARGATGSRGTWGLIMRKVQREVEKQRLADAKKTTP